MRANAWAKRSVSTNHYLYTLVVHTLCLDQLYCCTFLLYSRLCTPVLILTNESPSKITLMNRVNQSQGLECEHYRGETDRQREKETHHTLKRQIHRSVPMWVLIPGFGTTSTQAEICGSHICKVTFKHLPDTSEIIHKVS